MILRVSTIGRMNSLRLKAVHILNEGFGQVRLGLVVLRFKFKYVNSRECIIADFWTTKLKIKNHPTARIPFPLYMCFRSIVSYTILEQIKIAKCVRKIIPDSGTVYFQSFCTLSVLTTLITHDNRRTYINIGQESINKPIQIRKSIFRQGNCVLQFLSVARDKVFRRGGG